MNDDWGAKPWRLQQHDGRPTLFGMLCIISTISFWTAVIVFVGSK